MTTRRSGAVLLSLVLVSMSALSTACSNGGGGGSPLAAATLPHWNGLPYYRPLSRMIFALERLAFGMAPAPYHLFNAVLVIDWKISKRWQQSAHSYS